MGQKTTKKQQIAKNSDIIKHTLFSLITVSQSKTSDDYAWAIIKKILTELKPQFDFLKYIHIEELNKIGNNMEDINIQPDFENIEQKQIGQAIQEIVDTFKTKMGKQAGYFFFEEFKDKLGDKYQTELKKIGVDLRLMDLQSNVYGFQSSTNYKIKDDQSSNIAFIEKK